VEATEDISTLFFCGQPKRQQATMIKAMIKAMLKQSPEPVPANQ
jgi:hypothetical protein